MVSITQAFAVDLTGQVCIDQYDGEFYGGVSTQPDFIRGAAKSSGGKPIICLASSSDDTSESRIRAQLKPGEGVGIARYDVHYVITEFGIAYLFGKSIRERALSLIEVAHPSFREALLEQAKALGYVAPSQYIASRTPYHIGEERRIRVKDSTEVLVRPARATDAQAIQGLCVKMTAEDIYSRFFRRLRTLSYQEAQALCNVNQETTVAFVAVHGPREQEEIVGSSCYFLDPATNFAEVAYMVLPEWQGTGIGTALYERMRDYAVRRGVLGFVAEILTGNARMLRLANRTTEEISFHRDEDVVRVTSKFRRANEAPST
jgi:GNAT superfamily N-acetyltransferase